MVLTLALVTPRMVMSFAIKLRVLTVLLTAITLLRPVCVMRRDPSPLLVFMIGNTLIKVTDIGNVTPYATGHWRLPISLISSSLTWRMDRTIMANSKARATSVAQRLEAIQSMAWATITAKALSPATRW